MFLLSLLLLLEEKQRRLDILRGDYDEESDIDVMIMVDLPPEELVRDRTKITYFCADLSVDNDVFISPKLQSLPLFEQWKNALPFYQNVIREGVVVYG